MAAVPMDWLRAVYDEWGRGNFRAGADRLAPDFEFSTGRDFPDPARGVTAGEAVRDYWRGFLSSWAHLRIEALEMTPVGDRVLILVRQTGTGRSSGVETSLDYFHVWRFGDAGASRLDVLLGAGEAHIEQLRGLYDAWAQGDFDVGADLFAPEIEFVTSEGFPDAPGPGEGLERVEHWRDEFLASFQELRIEALELEPIGERVLVRVRQRGRFRTTGIDVDVTYFQLWTFSGGRATRFQVFAPGAEMEARAAADP
jgi:ketosteroid isomerase-like protein